jgi:hypothetical protein
VKRLSRLSKDCLDLSLDHTKILEKLRAKERNSTWQVVMVTCVSMRREKAVASIEKRLDHYNAEIVIR